MVYNYQAGDVTSCLGSRHVVFIGDSVTRQLYFQFAHSIDQTLPSAPPDDEHKHADYNLRSVHDLQLSFYWDPFLNSTAAQSYIHGSSAMAGRQDRPALLVLGSGLWYLRYADSGGLPVWESMMEFTVGVLSRAQTEAADVVVILPVEDVVPSKLSPDRAASMHASDIDAMNSDLLHRVRPPAMNDPFSLSSSGESGPPRLGFPSVFNQMLDQSQTEDGLHFSEAVVKMQANLLLNLRCNDVLPKVFPHDKTCCRSYPFPSFVHLLVLMFTVLWGPLSLIIARRFSELLSIPRLEVSHLFLSRQSFQRRVDTKGQDACDHHWLLYRRHLSCGSDWILAKGTEAVQSVYLHIPGSTQSGFRSVDDEACRK